MGTQFKLGSMPEERPLLENEKLALDDFEMCISLVKEGKSKTEDPAKVHYRSGIIYQRAGQLDKAEKQFQETITSPDKDLQLEAYTKLLYIHRWLEKDDAAIRDLEKIMEIDPAAESFCANEIGVIYSKNGCSEKAILFFERAINTYNKSNYAQRVVKWAHNSDII